MAFTRLTGLAPVVDNSVHRGLTTSLVPARSEPDDGFVRRAAHYLHSWTLSEALALAAEVQGYWHPTGFMVFHVEHWFGPMPVRVHCWPKRSRRRNEGHPARHNHLWPLASKVLVGTYSEIMYVVDEAPDGDYAQYNVRYHDRNDSTVVEDSRRFRILPLRERTAEVGEIHHLRAGVFHQTTVPPTERVVTVMVTGLPQIESCALMAKPGFDAVRRERWPVTPREFKEAVGDLLNS